MLYTPSLVLGTNDTEQSTARDELVQLKRAFDDPAAAAAVAAAVAAALRAAQAELPAADSERSGGWSPEEEEYATKFIQLFEKGWLVEVERHTPLLEYLAGTGRLSW